MVLNLRKCVALFSCCVGANLFSFAFGGECTENIKVNIYSRDLEQGSPNTFELVCEICNATNYPVSVFSHARIKYEDSFGKSVFGLESKAIAVPEKSEGMDNLLTIIIVGSDEEFPMMMDDILSIRGDHDSEPIVIDPGKRVFLKLSIHPELKSNLQNAQVYAVINRKGFDITKSNTLFLRKEEERVRVPAKVNR